MTGNIEFETPENVQVSYQTAGLGTRFLAWFVDKILMTVLGFVLFLVLLIVAASTEGVFRQLFKPLRDMAERTDPSDPSQMEPFVMYGMGIWFVVWSFGNFLYYGCCEWLMRGQSIGKRLSSIRVVKADGFSLDAGSIVVRNLFRVIDHLPPFWIVPLLSAKSQRFGDMAADTVVIIDKREEMNSLREILLLRPMAECRFHFDATTLKRARRSDIEAIERILERWRELTAEEQNALLEQIVTPLTKRLKTDPPEPMDRSQFLQDLLTAEYRRQSRKLG